MGFEKVAQIEDIPGGRGLRVHLRGIEVGLFRVGDDVYAMENACPHAGDPLSEGVLDGCVIVCEAHGWDFDVRTGHRPDDADGFPIPCFAVSIQAGAVWIDLDDVTNMRRRPRGGENDA
jgi:nitrite reductase/ring-hydroxylating ferredoxin subunit